MDQPKPCPGLRQATAWLCSALWCGVLAATLAVTSAMLDAHSARAGDATHGPAGLSSNPCLRQFIRLTSAHRNECDISLAVQSPSDIFMGALLYNAKGNMLFGHREPKIPMRSFGYLVRFPVAPDGDHALVLWCAPGRCESVDLVGISGKMLRYLRPNQMPPLQWVSWSPDSAYALLAEGTTAGATRIDLVDVHAGKLASHVFAKAPMHFQLQSVEWDGSRDFTMLAPCASAECKPEGADGGKRVHLTIRNDKLVVQK